MESIVFAALSSAFFLVRIVKGPWMRNPQYVAAALIGSVLVSLALYRFAPGLENDMIVGGLAGAAGAWGGILVFDMVLAG